MLRRTFLASIPATAIAAPLLAQARSAPPPVRPKPAAPPRWEAGAVRFDRPDVHSGDRPVGASFASRTAVYGVSGAVGAAHPLATQAGIDILKRGGSAVDAAVASEIETLVPGGFSRSIAGEGATVIPMRALESGKD